MYGDGAAIGVVNRVVDDFHVFEAARSHCAEFDAACAAAGGAVAHLHVLAYLLVGVRLQADGIVARVDVAVGEEETVAVDDVDAVVVPEDGAMDAHVVHPDVFALVVHRHPIGGVAEGDIVDFHVFALPEMQQPCTMALGHAVVAQSVVDEAFVDKVGAVVGQLASLPVDAAAAVVVADDSDVFDPFGHDEGAVVDGLEAVVVEGVGAADQHGSFDELDGDVRLEVDAARQVAAHSEAECAAALPGNPVDGVLDAACVHRNAVAAYSEQRGVVGGFVLGEGLQARQEDEGEDGLFHIIVLVFVLEFMLASGH